MRFKNLSPREAQTAGLLLVAAIFNGLVQSFGQTQDIIARKALLATDWQILLITLIWPISNFLSIWMGRIFEQSCHKSRYFLIAGIFGRLTLVWALFMAGIHEYLILLALLYSANSLLVPAQNGIYQRNINVSRRAKVYGYTISIGMLISIIVTFFAGRLLDIQESAYRWIVAATGIAGFISCVVLSRIKIDEPVPCEKRPNLPLRQALADPIHSTIRLLKENPQFAAFERSFSIYGMGFIMMTPVIPLLLVNELKLSYTVNFLTKGILSQAGMLFLSPLIGKIHDRLHPFRFISLSFGTLMFFPLVIIVATKFAGIPALATTLVFVAYIIFGIAMAGINMAWNMSSIFFAGKENAAVFQSVHVTMTGIRGLIAPFLGLILNRLFGYSAVFLVASGFLATAAIISFRDYRKIKAGSFRTA
ncbi:MAG: hypothetical protein CVU49_06870 [Candidatus Cloacimonetes bacterium HGW-Cloacimonetes-2]|nr:MAG: hypothetical protein CVU49_06870 [Candidatus Cloacimonetes bacterium HGW-Cloacimonetes-2]